MKKRTISKLKSLFGSKKGKRQKNQEQSAKSSRSPSPEPAGETSLCESYRPLVRTPPPSHVAPPPSPPVPTNPVAPVAPEPAGPLPLMPCPVCGRTFVPLSLAKHVKICEKMTVRKRKTFDSSRQRREGTDLEQYLPKNFGLPENSPFLEKSPPHTAKVTPKPKTQSVRSAITKPMAELQKCPHCARAFGVRAFERHVEWCADKAKILPAAAAQPPPHVADAKQRLHARTQYKAPPVRARRSSQSREKASNSRSTSVDSSRGVSPPREFGDYKQGRTRASESMSSNDCHEDASMHVPVIRNSRTSQNNSGDANVKARQARLARDLSNTRNTQDPKFSSIQQSSTDPNVSKVLQSKHKNKVNSKRKQQLKKLEEIANKYNNRQEQIKEGKDKSRNSINNNVEGKSNIPVLNKTVVSSKNKTKMGTMVGKAEKTKEELKSPSSLNKAKTKGHPVAVKQQNENPAKFRKLKSVTKNSTTKENTMSLDSLDGVKHNKNNAKKFQSIGINTELLCPCVPCVIYDCPEQKKMEKLKTKSKVKEISTSINKHNSVPSIELLYKNPNIISSSDLQIKHITETQLNSIDINSDIHYGSSSINSSSSNSFPNKTHYDCEETSAKEENSKVIEVDDQEPPKELCEEKYEELNNLSAEEYEENYEPDISAEISNDSIENDGQLQSKDISRHGSGDTYTKFSECPADLEEFYNLTDKIITTKIKEKKLDTDLDTLHTPNTNSIEVLNKNDSRSNFSDLGKHQFSDTLEELKSDFKEILKETDSANADYDLASKNIKTVRNMEHISVFEVNFCEKGPDENTQHLNEAQSEFKLPSITETNNMMKRDESLRNTLTRAKISRKYNFNKQSRNNTEYKTFIVRYNQDDNSDVHSVSSEAPPLKLPRIEVKRLDDNYDPFASAARQMKELMSSETNIPKKIQTIPKDSNRTLPSLRPTKEKTSPSHLTNNTKMMKDTLNKTYQKTPTLQRMKSFGSTNSENNNSFGGRCSSFRINRNDKKSSQKLNTTFTKSSKENISSTEKPNFTRNSNLNRSFSNFSYIYSTPKLKDKSPKIAPSMYHSFQRTTIKQPLKLDKIKNDEDRKNFVNLDSILSYDNASMTDSNYIDPRLINENDNLPINVNTILNNPDIISSMESLLTTENLPAKFESFNVNNKNIKNSLARTDIVTNYNNTNKSNVTSMNELNSQYDKFMSSLEQSITSKTSRDDESLCEDFDLEEFMTSFDEEVTKQKIENKRTYSSTTRIVTQSEIFDTHKSSDINGNSDPAKALNNNNGMIPVNKSMSLVFSSNNVKGENLFPSSVKRSTSLLDSIQKKNTLKADTTKNRLKADQLEQDIMQSLKDFDKFYESERIENDQSNKEIVNCAKNIYNTTKKESRTKTERKKQTNNKNEHMSNGQFTPNGKPCNDSAYSSLNRISPSKLSLCNSKESNGLVPLAQAHAGTDTISSHKDEIRSISSEEFLAMERSAELNESLPRVDAQHKDLGSSHTINEKRASSRASSQRSPTWRSRQDLSSSSSESSLHRAKETSPQPRLSRFCHECGNKFPVDTAKFCIECGVKRLVV
ncbi:unnamed protein product [Parnassius apollo]|uniref:(apollo) hypothetical protein n=1 Tax=Parnassius apollo TaxID=110799 RepID=A0A8S3W5H3_PARAO|nr:unnamed protein product [Parnassius apollo]